MIWKMVLVVVTSVAAGGAARSCIEEVLGGTEVKFHHLQLFDREKTVLPFSINMLESSKWGPEDEVQFILATSGSSSRAIYTFTFSPTNGLELSEEGIGGVKRALDQSRMFGYLESQSKGSIRFSVVIRLTEDKFVLQLQSGEDPDDVALQATIDKEEDAGNVPRVFGFRTVTGAGSRRILVEFGCRLSLLEACIHHSECRDPHSICSLEGGYGSTSKCLCGRDYVLHRSDASFSLRCVESNVRIGDPCSDSIQCGKLEAKCRSPSFGSGPKTCRCLDGMEVKSTSGVCQDSFPLSVDFRPRDALPGYPAATERSVKERKPCGFSAHVNGPLGNPDAAKYFPIFWRSEGFSHDFRVKGDGDFKVGLSRCPHELCTSVYEVELREDSGFLNIKFRDLTSNRDVDKILKCNQATTSFLHDANLAFSLKMACDDGQWGSLKHNCSLAVSESDATENGVSFDVGDPFESPLTWPSFISVVPMSALTRREVHISCEAIGSASSS